MKNSDINIQLKVILISLVWCMFTVLIAIPHVYSANEDSTPIKVSLSYAHDQYYYNKGDIETIHFKFYINKSDSIYYQPGHRYLLWFDDVQFSNEGFLGWIIMETSITNRKVFLDDNNSFYQGFIKTKNTKNQNNLTFAVGLYRIAETKDKYGGEYPEIYNAKYRSDQRIVLDFRNPKIEVLNGEEIRIIDFDNAIQDSLIEKHRRNFQRHNFYGTPDLILGG